MARILPKLLTGAFALLLLAAAVAVFATFDAKSAASWIALSGLVISLAVLLNGSVLMTANFLTSKQKREEMVELYEVGKRLAPVLQDADRIFMEIAELKKEKEAMPKLMRANVKRKINLKYIEVANLFYSNSNDLTKAARLQASVRSND